MAERFFCPDAALGETELALVGDEMRHLAKVRRVKQGEHVEVFNGQGFATVAEVVSFQRDRVLLRPVGSPLPDRVAPLSVTLATSLPKGDRVDWLVEKVTELGVARLIPLVTERTVVDPRAAKLDRLRRNVIETSKQCGRNRLMNIESTITFKEFLRFGVNNVMLCHPAGTKRFAVGGRSGFDPACVAVGPEGGFTDEEVGAAMDAGWTIGSLGATILRIETAGIVACARVLAMAELWVSGKGDER